MPKKPDPMPMAVFQKADRDEERKLTQKVGKNLSPGGPKRAIKRVKSPA